MNTAFLRRLALVAAIAIGASACPDDSARPAAADPGPPVVITREDPKPHSTNPPPAEPPTPPPARPAGPAAASEPTPKAGEAPPLDAAHLDLAGHPCQCGGECHCGHCSGMIAGCHCKPKRADGK